MLDERNWKAMSPGVVYALWSVVGVVSTVVIATTASTRSVDLPALVGIAVIIGGVMATQVSSTATGH